LRYYIHHNLENNDKEQKNLLIRAGFK